MNIIRRLWLMVVLLLYLGQAGFALPVGVNVPWIYYGLDVGANNFPDKVHVGVSSYPKKLEQAISKAQEYGINNFREFLLGDLRSGYIFTPVWHLDEYALKDIRAILEIYKKKKAKGVFVLLDFMVADGKTVSGMGEHPEIVSNLKTQTEFINATLPIMQLMEEYREQVTAVEFMNEPEHTIFYNSILGRIQLETFFRNMQVSFAQMAPSIHFTIGAATSYSFVQSWSGLPLDLFQIHYYFTNQHYLPYVWEVSLGVPTIVGELPPAGIPLLREIMHRGYEGVYLWSLNSQDGFALKEYELETISTILSD